MSTNPVKDSILDEICSNEICNISNCSDETLCDEICSNECCICLNMLNLNDMMITKCNHHMHKSCLTPWFSISSTCPMCRANINSDDYRITVVKYNNTIKTINIPDMNGLTPLIIASKNNDVKTVKILLELGADLTIADNFNKTAYMYALSTNNTELINLLN